MFNLDCTLDTLGGPIPAAIRSGFFSHWSVGVFCWVLSLGNMGTWGWCCRIILKARVTPDVQFVSGFLAIRPVFHVFGYLAE